MLPASIDFSALYLDFQAKIQRYLSRLVGEDEAEDLTQEVFIKAERALAGFRGESSPATWLYRIATNTAFDRLRSSSCRHAGLDLSLDSPPEGAQSEAVDQNPWTREKAPLLEQQVQRSEMNHCILSYIARLPEIYRTVVLLSDMAGLSNLEIAEILGVSLETVKIRLHRARSRLKEDFETGCEYYWAEEVLDLLFS